MLMQIRSLSGDELTRIQQDLPPEHPEAHVRRLADQRDGRITYLVAWVDGRAVGHGIVRWHGTTNPELRWLIGDQTAHPYVEALLVHPSFRSRSIGSQLLEAAETLARTRDHTVIGLAVNVENGRAQALYERLGYDDAGIGQFENAWSYVDEAGQEVAERETCIYLVKSLGRRVGSRT
jgi:ribosomal protein S18 acetylase RimI-like enzyme